MLRLLLFCLTLFLSLAAFAKEVSFVSYNLRNYAPLPESEGAKPSKSEASVAAVMTILKDLDADILGLQEMGSQRQFEAFLQRLAAAGLDYPYTEWVAGGDPDRHLVLLSRYPIIARQSRGEVPFQANGQREKMRRGILDVTVQIGEKTSLRVLGVHLKSKLSLSEDEELIRRHEAHLLRRHVDGILKDDPKTYLLLFGDFNDTKNRPSVQEVAGVKGSPTALLPITMSDEVGDRWTHYWAAADTYARIDFLFISRSLIPHLQPESCFVYRSPDWITASDHRPLKATFRFNEF